MESRKKDAGKDPCKVLVVEDHADSAAIASRLLSASGYAVEVADGYSIAVSKARAGRFDVLVCDIGLPDGDGCDLFREVREMYEIRGVALTGYGMRGDRERCERAGFGHFLMKPVTLDELQAAVDSATDGLPCAKGTES